jgi:hypothetical protein
LDRRPDFVAPHNHGESSGLSKAGARTLPLADGQPGEGEQPVTGLLYRSRLQYIRKGAVPDEPAVRLLTRVSERQSAWHELRNFLSVKHASTGYNFITMIDDPTGEEAKELYAHFALHTIVPVYLSTG